MAKNSGMEEEELIAMQNKVSSILGLIFRNINGIIDYLNRRGASYDPSLKKVITQVLEALKSVEYTERSELTVINALEKINKRFKGKGLQSKIRRIVVDEEMLERQLGIIMQGFNKQGFNRDSLGKIISLENDLITLIDLVNVELQR